MEFNFEKIANLQTTNQQFDSMITYFVPHGLIINGSDQEILDYIYYHIESAIYDDFN